MTKDEFISQLAAKLNSTKAQAQQQLQAVLDTLSEVLH